MSLLRVYFGEDGCVAAALAVSVLLFVFGRGSNLYILRCNMSYFIICLFKTYCTGVEHAYRK